MGRQRRQFTFADVQVLAGAPVVPEDSFSPSSLVTVMPPRQQVSVHSLHSAWKLKRLIRRSKNRNSVFLMTTHFLGMVCDPVGYGNETCREAEEWNTQCQDERSNRPGCGDLLSVCDPTESKCAR